MIIENNYIILESDHDRQLIWDALYQERIHCYDQTDEKWKNAVWYDSFLELGKEYDCILEKCYKKFTGILH